MNNRKKGSLPQLRVSRQVRAKTLRLWGVYLLALLAWVALAIVLTLFFASLPWSLTPFYGALIWLRNYIVFVCIAFVLAGWAVISFFFLARPILTIFTPDAAVLDIGVDMVRFLAPCYITYILIELLNGAIRGAGKSLVPMIISVLGVCVLRLAWIFFVVPMNHTLIMVAASYPITWTVTTVAIVIYYLFGHWLEPREKTMEKA